MTRTGTALLLALALGAPFAHAADAPAPPPAKPPVEEKATKDDYELDVSGTATKLAAGAEGAFVLVVRPKNGKKVHAEAPLELTFKDNKDVKPGKAKLGRADVVDKAATAPELRTTLHAVNKGGTTLEATVSFFLCTDAWCQRMSDRIAVPITIE